MILLDDRNERLLAHHVGGLWRAPFSTRMASVSGNLRVVLADRRDAARAWVAACAGQRALALSDTPVPATVQPHRVTDLRPSSFDVPLLLPPSDDANILLETITSTLAMRRAVVALAMPSCADALLERYHAFASSGWPPGAINLLYADADAAGLFPV